MARRKKKAEAQPEFETRDCVPCLGTGLIERAVCGWCSGKGERKICTKRSSVPQHEIKRPAGMLRDTPYEQLSGMGWYKRRGKSESELAIERFNATQKRR